MKNILIIDTKAGNLFSLRSAIDRLGYRCQILGQPDNQVFDAIVIPGQGRFAQVMAQLRDNQWIAFLTQRRDQNIPILGICVGMQIFFESSAEDPDSQGLGWFQGRAEKLASPKTPMVGWARLQSLVWPEACVYFVNSYAIKASQYSIATTQYGEEFCAAVKKDCVTGVQFHPEKSAQIGATIIQQALCNSGLKT